ncbi:unnamed protein product [Effrenium voratum]|uniref:Uncharacterized protein n=1 Tax=Effrenium voratum TaxID=2562239 RepID=A0AA36HZP1_9DINO|nr:unnamed protein product [Effrenium voratum]
MAQANMSLHLKTKQAGAPQRRRTAGTGETQKPAKSVESTDALAGQARLECLERHLRRGPMDKDELNTSLTDARVHCRSAAFHSICNGVLDRQPDRRPGVECGCSP